MHILLAEDDLRLGRLVQHMLEKEDMKVDWVVDGSLAFEYAVYSSYDIIILDWMMPGESGLNVCDRLRKQGYQGAILMLTARDAVEDRVLGLDTGADDYLVKPFEFSELMARIRALSRRNSNKLIENVVIIGNLIFNRTTKLLKYDDKEIYLSGREFQMLDLLIQNKGQVVPREVILDRVWGLESEVTSNNLDAYVRLLRKKIDPPGGETLIHTIRGVGYRLEE
ncbi:MAG: two component transcriptional regulator, winged helix family [Pelosinus sp.]|nr:two component transcriptional regulator, winged helix family [Pelosinus sp.]